MHPSQSMSFTDMYLENEKCQIIQNHYQNCIFCECILDVVSHLQIGRVHFSSQFDIGLVFLIGISETFRMTLTCSLQVTESHTMH